MTLSFEDLLAPLTPDEFVAEYRDRKPLLVRGRPDKFAGVLSWDEINRLLNMSRIWSHHTLSLFLDGVAVPPQEYCRLVTRDGGGMISRPDARMMRRFIQQGASVIMNDIDTLSPGLSSIVMALQAGGYPGAWANAYISWKERRAFKVHGDTHDVWVVQVEGHKTWNIWQNRSPWPTDEHGRRIPSHEEDVDKGELLHEWVLGPGDLLYLPWGWFHDALASSDASVHITYGVHPVNGLDLAKLLMERMLEDPDFRQPMPWQDGTEEARALLAEHAARLGDKLAGMCRSAIILDGLQGVVAGHHRYFGGHDLLRARARPSVPSEPAET